jgi:pimeloyl-ACP methyl ester carboxylesterase
MESETVSLSERWTIVAGLPMFFRAATEPAPTGATPIVHVHGFGISGRYLLPTAERLAPFYPTYVPDLPGYGRSHKPSRTLTIPELAHALAAFLDQVGVERAVLLGNSMGCLIAIEFAHAYPDRIDRAILVSPAGGPHNQPLYRGLPQLARDGLRETPRMLPVAVPDYVRFGPLSSLRLFKAMTHYPTVERALGLDLPMLAVAGARDPLVSKERLRELVATRPNLTLVIHDRAAHAINFSHPQALASVVRAWLEGRPIVVEGAEPGEVAVLGQASAGPDGEHADPPVEAVHVVPPIDKGHAVPPVAEASA